MKKNLSHKIGIVIPHHELRAIDTWLSYGCRHFRIGIEWSVFNPRRDEHIFHVAEEGFRTIQQAGGKILVHLFGVPPYLDPAVPSNRAGALPIMRDEWVIDWVDYVSRFLEWVEQFGDTVEVCGPIVETNLPGWWQDETTKRERSAEDFLRLVVRPATPLIRVAGKKVIAGTVTLQGERSWTFNRAMRQLEIYKTKSFAMVDHLDFHVYREVGNDTVNDIKRVFRHFDYIGKPFQNPVWISELGFNEKKGFYWYQEFFNNLKGRNFDGQQRQERKYKDLFRFLESDDLDAERIKRIYLYRSHDVESEAGTDGLLKANFQPKRAALLVREYLQAA